LVRFPISCATRVPAMKVTVNPAVATIIVEDR
jgi:hypothetical protein